MNKPRSYFLTFVEEENKNVKTRPGLDKTKIWKVARRDGSKFYGRVKWNNGPRKYVFYSIRHIDPEIAFYTSELLYDIGYFCDYQTWLKVKQYKNKQHGEEE